MTFVRCGTRKRDVTDVPRGSNILGHGRVFDLELSKRNEEKLGFPTGKALLECCKFDMPRDLGFCDVNMIGGRLAEPQNTKLYVLRK